MQNTKIMLKNEDGKEYILEYNRQSVQQIERLGFSIEDVSRKPMIMFPLMFRGAFLANCKYVKEKEINELYEKMTKKDELHSALMNMINECYESLMENEENSEGNVGWEIV
jgi:hypothetical protein